MEQKEIPPLTQKKLEWRKDFLKSKGANGPLNTKLKGVSQGLGTSPEVFSKLVGHLHFNLEALAKEAEEGVDITGLLKKFDNTLLESNREGP
jgi:hypothetical protein